MKRREFLQVSGAAATALAVRPVWAEQTKHPNLLIIQTDEHNFRTLGCYRATLSKEQAFMWGPAVVETPNIDWIAKNGALCTRFYATTPVCSPSRSAFVSGRYPQNTPVTTNDIPMNDEVVTFAEILRRQGYATGYAGKWHLDGQGKPQWAPKRKFGFTDNTYMFNRGHWKQLEDTPSGPRIKAQKGGKPTYDVPGADEKSFTTDFLADKTVDFIRAHKGEPFCYMVSIPDPHGPDTVRHPYDTMFKDQTYTQPPSARAPEAGLPSWGSRQSDAYNQSKYYGMVKCIDDNVGKILKALREAGVLEHTFVVFTSDHGDLRGEHARQNKGVPYEGSAKIAFLLYAPGKVKAGAVVTQALSCVDFLPTIIPLMGFQTAGKEQGRDASALFTTGRAPDGWKDAAFFRGTGSGNSVNWLAAVNSRYKIVFAPRDNPWLFDLEKDPDEMTNFFTDPACREVVRELSKALVEYAKAYGDHYASDPKIRADLEWGVSGEGPYKPTPPAPAGKAGGKGKGRGKNAADVDKDDTE